MTPPAPGEAPRAGAPTSGGRRWVRAFSEGDRTMAGLLGGKGAGLAEMTRLGLPVPPGFTITTQACREHLATGQPPQGLRAEVDAALADLERLTGRRLGSPADPLLLSVRSGARFSMPGMMDTVLDVGTTDDTVGGLARRGGERLAWDCYRRLVQMFGSTVMGVPGALFEQALAAARDRAGVVRDQELDAAALRELVRDLRGLLVQVAGEDLPQDPHEQLHRAVRAVFASWGSERARAYRAQEGIPEDLGTAVTVQAMVLGNTGPRSGSGVCFTRDPATGAPGTYGDYLQDAQGEDVVAGTRATVPLAELARVDPGCHAELLGHLRTLEHHYRDLCDVEFTIEDGRLWVLQTRVGKRTAAAAFRIAADLHDEGLIGLDEALRRVDGAQLERLAHPRFAVRADRHPLARGLAASPGAGVGEVALDPATAVRLAEQGHRVVLVRTETSPEDLPGMIAADAVVTARGGLTSHAAVVARGMGLACVTGVEGLRIDPVARTVTAGSAVLREGDVVSVDGTSGEVFAGAVDVEPSEVATALERGGGPRDGDSPLVRAVLRLLAHADACRRLGVRANADTAADAARARRLGAEGVGLCRTEHTLLGERRRVVEDLVLGEGEDQALAELLELHRADLAGVLEAMDGLPVVVRLLDPPLHEFLPDLTDLSVRAARQEAAGEVDPALLRQLEGVRRWHESNPMLGLRGVRLGAVVPEVFSVQVCALAHATLDLRERGLDPRPEIMVPLVGDRSELVAVRRVVSDAVAAVSSDRGVPVPDIPVGTMVELPRAALTAGRLAEVADFFSFGTNDLTQTTWGMSRDDAEAEFLPQYRAAGLLGADPFATIDTEGVGRLVRIAVEEGRAARPGLGTGVCGEHGGDPASVRFFDEVGLDHVSCSPPRVPVARLEAGRAVVLAAAAAESETR